MDWWRKWIVEVPKKYFNRDYFLSKTFLYTKQYSRKQQIYNTILASGLMKKVDCWRKLIDKKKRPSVPVPKKYFSRDYFLSKTTMYNTTLASGLMKKMNCWRKWIVEESWLLKKVNWQEKEALCTSTKKVLWQGLLLVKNIPYIKQYSGKQHIYNTILAIG